MAPLGKAPGPWVLVCGGFHSRGAMDRANLALAEHLLAAGRDVHLVGHDIAPAIGARRGVHVHAVPKLGAVAAGELLLGRAGRRVARMVRAANPDVRVLVNGGNCTEPDVNWVHSVHQAWPVGTGPAPIAHRLKRAAERRWFRGRERRAITAARVVIANSVRTRRDLVDLLGVRVDDIHVIPPGCDPSWQPPSSEERCDARIRLDVSGPAVLFLGALGADDNKGFGPLLAAWRSLCAEPTWAGVLLVAGGGPMLSRWNRTVDAWGLGQRVRFLGFVSDVKTVLAASDLLVSASRYEAYGLAIAEALCRGVPAIVPENAGITPELGSECEGLIVRGPAEATPLADALRRWASEPARWRAAAAQTGARLRQYTLDDMAAAIVGVAEA